MKNVKITVLRKGFYPDLIREHLTEPPEECVCDFFREGDQFLYTGGAEMPAVEVFFGSHGVGMVFA